MKSHTITVSLIFPSCQAKVKTMFGVEAEKEINKIAFSDQTISRRITDMSNDIVANSFCKTLQVHGISTCKPHSAYGSRMALKRKRTVAYLSLERGITPFLHSRISNRVF